MSSSLVLAALSLLAHTAAFAPAPLASSARGLLRPVCLRTPPSLGLRMVAVEPERAVASKVALVSLGCPKNVVDAEVMLGDLQKKGFKVVRKPRDADVVIVNTCAFIDTAREESVRAVLEALELKEGSGNDVKGVVVTGCMAQRYAEELVIEMPELDAVMGFESYAQIAPQIGEIVERSGMMMPTVMVGDTDVPFRPEWERVRLTQQHAAFLRVAEGCNHKCTFCAIPTWRGSFRSKPFDSILEEARQLSLQGVTELNLIAEDTNQWGSDWGETDPRRLSDLLWALDGLEGIRRISLLYCYPSYFSEELIDAIANIDKVCKYVDIPLQHISDRMLKAMQRPSGKHTRELLTKLRARIPGLVLRTTFITGFPGENDEDHAEMVQYMTDMGFERAGVFAYSPEEGTPAASMPNQIPDEVKEARRDQLMMLVQRAQRKFARDQVGKTLEVVIDGPGEGGFGSVGRTRADCPDIDCVVHLPHTFKEGTYVEAKISDTYDFDLVGTVESEEVTPTPEEADAILSAAAGHTPEALGGQTQARRRASEAAPPKASPRRAA